MTKLHDLTVLIDPDPGGTKHTEPDPQRWFWLFWIWILYISGSGDRLELISDPRFGTLIWNTSFTGDRGAAGAVPDPEVRG